MSKFLIKEMVIAATIFVAVPVLASATRVVTGNDVVNVAKEMQRSGLVQDGILTPDGRPASRVFGIFRGATASCDYPWSSSLPVQCMIDPNIDLTAKLVVGNDAIKVANEMQKSGLVQDGILTPQGRPASRVFGAYHEKPASCDYPWSSSIPVQCLISADSELTN